MLHDRGIVLNISKFWLFKDFCLICAHSSVWREQLLLIIRFIVNIDIFGLQSSQFVVTKLLLLLELGYFLRLNLVTRVIPSSMRVWSTQKDNFILRCNDQGNFDPLISIALLTLIVNLHTGIDTRSNDRAPVDQILATHLIDSFNLFKSSLLSPWSHFLKSLILFWGSWLKYLAGISTWNTLRSQFIIYFEWFVPDSQSSSDLQIFKSLYHNILFL